MAVFYNKERAKYGNLTGQIIIWPVEYEGLPDGAVNAKNLPAGYLKCDGTKYYEKDYPQLAAICGVGDNCKFMRKNNDLTNFDTLTDSQFMVPDLGSKYPEPTSGANSGLYNNIRLDNALGTEVSRSGIAIEAVSAIGTNVRIDYSGSISVPSQEIDVRGKPSWTYAGATHRTDDEGVEENAIHPHTHFHSATRARNLAVTENSTNAPLTQGQLGRRNASTIPIQEWLDETTNSSGVAGSGQQPCMAIDKWSPGSGGGATSTQGLQCTIYWGHCIYGAGEQYTYNCISNASYTLNRGSLDGSADGANKGRYRNNIQTILFGCYNTGSGADTNDTLTVPVTYIANASGVPEDFLGNSLFDVLPLQANDSVVSGRATTDLENTVTDTVELPREGGIDPTIHNHRIDIDKGDHNYQVKTNAIVIPPENLSTTMTIGADSSVSIDSACAPFVVMEYLIKI